MGHALAQITGRKRVVLWAPEHDEHLYVEGRMLGLFVYVAGYFSTTCQFYVYSIHAVVPYMYVVMTEPDELLPVAGSSSRVGDIDSWNDLDFPLFRRAVPPSTLVTDVSSSSHFAVMAWWSNSRPPRRPDAALTVSLCLGRCPTAGRPPWRRARSSALPDKYREELEGQHGRDHAVRIQKSDREYLCRTPVGIL
jgi:hypothetical protein